MGCNRCGFHAACEINVAEKREICMFCNATWGAEHPAEEVDLWHQKFAATLEWLKSSRSALSWHDEHEIQPGRWQKVRNFLED